MATITLREPTKEQKGKIMGAAQRGELQTLQELTSSGVDVTGILNDYFNRTTLHLAAEGGHYNVMTFLCSQGAAVDNVDWLQRTPLHHAAGQGHTDCVALLTKRGANVNMKDEIGYTPLQLAVGNGRHKTVEYFIKQAKMDITQFDMKTQQRINELVKKAEDEQIKGDNQSGSHNIQQELNKNMIDFMLKARKENKTLKVRYGRVLFSGSSGAGKTCFYKLLLKRHRTEHHVSTGLAQSEQVVAAVKVDAHRKDKYVELNELDIKKEIVKLQTLLNIMATEEAKTPINELKVAKNEKVKFCGVEFIMAAEASSKAETVNQTEMIDELNIFTFMDTGGQPQFISMIPAVNSSAMVTFVVHDLQNGLNDRVTVSHGGEDGKQTFIPYTIGCTNLELIKSLISFTNNSFLQKKPFLKEICETRRKENNSYLSFVGTHLDQILAETNDEDRLHLLDNTLDAVLKDGGLEHVWMNVHAKYKYLIPVNNLTSEAENQYATHDSAAKIRIKLYDKIKEQEVYNVPIVWLLLELEIRNKCKKQKFITYQEVVKLCQQHDLIQEEVHIKNGLRFHHLFGVLLYFDEIPELANYVFTDYQWMFNNLTEIVYQSYLKHDQDNIKVETDFKWKGFFTESLLDKCELKLKHKSESLQETEMDFKQGFIKLLEHLRIVAPLKGGDKEIVYFMPSLLSTCDLTNYQCAVPPEVLPQDATICDKTEPLLIQFRLDDDHINSPGSFPRGTFCCLIIELLQDTSMWRLFWLDTKQKVFDNLVTLLYRQTGQYFTFIDRIFYLEVVLLQEKECSFNLKHYEIKQILKEALHKIGKKLNFYDFKLTFSFICQKCLIEDKHVLLNEVSHLMYDCIHGHSAQSSKYSIWDKGCDSDLLQKAMKIKTGAEG